MLTSLTKAAREYRAHAANAWTLADAATDPGTKRHYLDVARHWLDRALDYEAAELFGARL